MEAVTGAGAVEYTQERRELLSQTASRLQTTPNRVVEQASALQEQLREAQKRIEALERQIARGETGGMTQNVREVKGVKVLTARTSAANIETLRETGDHLRDRLGSGVVVLGTVINDE